MPAPAPRPPLWLAAAAVASFWVLAFSVIRLIRIFIDDPYANDFRIFYAAAKVGVSDGWSHLYDANLLRAAAAAYPVHEQTIDSAHYFVSPPPLAWIVAPLTALPEPASFALWTVLGLGAFVAAWAIACPFTGLARITLLFLGLALWPVEESLHFGQPTLLLIVLVAIAWQQTRRDRPIVAGALVAIAVMLKPQDVFLVPVALLVGGRLPAFLSFLGWVAALAIVSALSLGSSGIHDYLSVFTAEQSNPMHYYDTPAYVFGIGPAAYAAEFVLGALAMAVAYLRRAELDAVFALGVLGSVMSSPHMHELDYSLDVLAVWFVLRTGPGLAHRLWLLAGIPAGQFTALAIGNPLPELLWQTGWLGILGRNAIVRKRPVLAPAEASEK